ncbi:MAG: hypothetical protein AAF495_01590 [Pseudomonadota bacterium]
MPAGGQGEVEHHAVAYKDGGTFEPEVLEVNVGDHVMFINESQDYVWPASNIHPTHEIYPGFDPELGLEPGQSWSFEFLNPGEWRYHNHLKAHEGGTIVVLGAPIQLEQPVARAEEVDPESLSFQLLEPMTAEQVLVLFEDDRALTQAVYDHGPAPVVYQMSRHADELGQDCHQRAHALGRAAYELFGAAAFSISGHECQSGSFHGAMEAMFKERGTSDVKADTRQICDGTRNSFFRHQCVHGIGHGLMAWTNYGLPEALAICDNLDGTDFSGDRASCYSGVFMENVVGGLSGAMGHYTTYLSNEDPHYPCNALEKRYVDGCYFYHTSHMINLFRGDFSEVALACAEAPDFAHSSCYRSMGRDVGSRNKGDPEGALRDCGYVVSRKHRMNCVSGAVQDWLWEASGAGPALSFCRTAKDHDVKERCYTTILERAPKILTPAELTAFCAEVEPGYRRRIRVGEYFGIAFSVLNPWSEEDPLDEAFGGCRGILPQFYLFTDRVAGWFST